MTFLRHLKLRKRAFWKLFFEAWQIMSSYPSVRRVLHNNYFPIQTGASYLSQTVHDYSPVPFCLLLSSYQPFFSSLLSVGNHSPFLFPYLLAILLLLPTQLTHLSIFNVSLTRFTISIYILSMYLPTSPTLPLFLRIFTCSYVCTDFLSYIIWMYLPMSPIYLCLYVPLYVPTYLTMFFI